jgi:hypothetical protein
VTKRKRSTGIRRTTRERTIKEEIVTTDKVEVVAEWKW